MSLVKERLSLGLAPLLTDAATDPVDVLCEAIAALHARASWTAASVGLALLDSSTQKPLLSSAGSASATSIELSFRPVLRSKSS